MSALVQKFQGIANDANAIFAEREVEVEISQLAMLSGQNAFFIGEPGTAKSAVARFLAKKVVGARWFSTQLDPQSPKDAVLGPVDTKRLLDASEYVHNTAHMLPDSHFATLDELGQASPDTTLSLAGLLNPEERSYHELGREVTTPLTAVFATSNELLHPVTQKKIWDRFTLRRIVSEIEAPEEFERVILGYSATGDDGAPLILSDESVSLAEFEEAREEVSRVTVPRERAQEVREIHYLLRGEGVLVSSRTWGAIVGDIKLGTDERRTSVLKAMAWLDGRDTVTSEDLTILRHALWSTPDQIRVIAKVVGDVADPIIRTSEALVGQCIDIMRSLTPASHLDDLRTMEGQLGALRGDAGCLTPGRSTNAARREIQKAILRVKGAITTRQRRG